MKLSKDFLIHNTNSDTVLVPVGGTGFSVLELLKTDVSEEEIVASLKSRFDAPEGAIERDVKKALNELRKIGAIDE